jgi:hypothetical protein
VDAAALALDATRGHLGVDHAGAGGHPLHVAGAEAAAVADGVLVLELALEDVADGLEAAVRMVGRADRLSGGVVDRAHLVEHQEGVDEAEAGGRERAADDEAGALALAVGGDQPGDGTGSELAHGPQHGAAPPPNCAVSSAPGLRPRASQRSGLKRSGSG